MDALLERKLAQNKFYLIALFVFYSFFFTDDE